MVNYNIAKELKEYKEHVENYNPFEPIKNDNYRCGKHFLKFYELQCAVEMSDNPKYKEEFDSLYKKSMDINSYVARNSQYY